MCTWNVRVYRHILGITAAMMLMYKSRPRVIYYKSRKSNRSEDGSIRPAKSQ